MALDEASPVLVEAKSPEFLVQGMKELLGSITKTHLDPPLTVNDLDPELFDKIKPSDEVDDYYKSSLEAAHKAVLYDIAQEQNPDDEQIIVDFANLMDLALICTELDLVEGLPFNLLEELFDTQTIPASERLFNYLESRVERLTVGMEGGKGKALVLLRLCNELLRRLSKAEDTIFCGRILIFLSKSFPIAERSAVNLRGEFNTENVTIFDDIPEETSEEQSAQNVDSMEVDDDMKVVQPVVDSTSSDDKTKSTINGEKSISIDKLYTMFWSMQHDFADPTRLFNTENFQRFKDALAATMQKFKEAEKQTRESTGDSTKAEPVAPSKSLSDDSKTTPVAGTKRKREDVETEGFNPKYLTSRELFELEIYDLTFRRNVLVQAMILLDFLLSLTPAAKEKWSDPKNTNRAVQYAFTLGPEDEAWVTKTKDQMSGYLQAEQKGKLFMRLIDTVLAREKNWIAWKTEGCHPFDIPAMKKEEVESAEVKAMNHCKAERPFPYTMGTPTLNRLWVDTGRQLHIDDLMDEDRRRVPTVESFSAGVDNDLEELKDAMFPADIDECHNNIQTKTWKALRLASGSRLHVFNRFDDRFDETRNDIKMLEEKTQEDLKPRVIATATTTTPAA
ncbi:THO complex, subunit THOC1 [Pyronema omphalodes]|nr:THO complex, subunit THOC1 [Pyronema omphalodes]